MKKSTKKNNGMVMTVILSIVSVLYVLPVVAVILNSFKANTFVMTDIGLEILTH